MSAPISPDDRAVGPPERLHPLFLLKGLRGSLRSLGGAYALVGYLAVSGRWTTALFAAVGIILFGVVRSLVYWTRFEFRVGRDEIRIDSGILSRRHRSIPFDRIQDVDITQGPLARLLGLAEVKFETGAGGTGPDADEGVLHAIALARAAEIRDLIRASRGAARPRGAVDAGERPPVYAMSLGRVFLAGSFNFSLAVFAGLIGATQTIGQPLGFDPFRESFWRDLVAASGPVEQFLLAHRLSAIVAGFALLVVIGLATGVIRTLLRDFGFRLDRAEAGLRRRRGLLTRTDVTLPVKRAQAAIVASGAVRNAFGWSEMSLQSLAGEEGGKGDHVVAPLASLDEVDEILAQIGWRPLPSNAQWRRVSSAYVWLRALALAPLLVLAPLVIGINVMALKMPGSVLGVALPAVGLVFALALVARWIGWLRTAYARDGDRMLMRSGWWRQRLVVLPVAKIQSIDLTENFVTRWFGAADLRFGVAGGTLRGELIPAIPSAAARELRDDLIASTA
ncbi:MAG TPA: PH domain-containing protein [Sphingomicrobium sp.]|nr:PH domain-containing protein [Sphingomicrobium sp.]